MPEILVRHLLPIDAGPAATLAGQLGYDVTAPAVRSWIANRAETHVALVATISDEVVGWIQAHDRSLLQSASVVEIGGLVVAEERRGSGIGRVLMDAVTDWGRERGHTEVFVRSNVIRDDAHRFYEGLGFRRIKTSHSFCVEIE